jgi:hypothetical protein
MITAMQELITHLEMLKSRVDMVDVDSLIEYATNKLEKEKEQIIDAWGKGYSTGCVVGSNDYTNEDEEKDNGNYYYNQTYNQDNSFMNNGTWNTFSI